MSNPNQSNWHIPVLPQEVIEGLNLQQSGNYLDCTVGGGGHSRLILANTNATLTAIDRDAQALAVARDNLAEFSDRVKFWHGNFRDFRPQSEKFDGVLADLGVSSAQLDVPDRGFSFRGDGPLDMRMDQGQELTAAKIVNTYKEEDLANIIFQLGEERYSRRIARAIVGSRPLSTTNQLAEVILRSVPGVYRHGRIHGATRTFQALRLATNQELESLQTWLAQAPEWLQPGGRLGVISFHSLEDRIVKYAFRGDERLEIITKKPIVSTPDEIHQNPRSRSAKLRIAQRSA